MSAYEVKCGGTILVARTFVQALGKVKNLFVRVADSSEIQRRRCLYVTND